MSEHVQGELEYVLTKYKWHGQPQLIPGPSGMNNATYMIQDQSGKAVIRMYNNHADISKLRFEHQVLSRLHHTKLPIATPVPIENVEHSTTTITPSGKLAAVFNYIEGERPSPQRSKAVLSLAKAAAHLSSALAQLKIEDEPSYTPYYELEQNYPAFTESDLLSLLAHEQLAKQEEKLLLIQAERIQLEQMKPKLQELPHQWIHGDLNCSNALAINDEIVALLDFEFVTWDLRAMELAVLLSEHIKPDNKQLEQKLKDMLQAYNDISPLDLSELRMLEALIRLRSVDVTMHFIERFKQGLDTADVLQGIVEHAAYVINTMTEMKLSSY